MTWSDDMKSALGTHADWIVPDWPAPVRVRAFVTTRDGGVSRGPYESLNLGATNGDDPDHVARNRAIVRAHLPDEPRWMAQVHGIEVADVDELAEDAKPRADAAVTRRPGIVATVLTADCMPLFLCDRAGRRAGVVHAGWRGMAAGVIEATVARMQTPPQELLAWMGPTIGPDAFEVGDEVREAFVARDAAADEAFRPKSPGKHLADLYALARQRLERAGVGAVYGASHCTFSEKDLFFSYRREKKSGRMGAFIWIE
jgi:YfiH family protein